MKRCDLPVGTHVQVIPFPTREQAPYRARIHGYDLGRSKYELDYEMSPGHFTEDGGWWVFPGEVEPIGEEG